MKSGRIIATISVFLLSLFLLAGCSTTDTTTKAYPVGKKSKRVNYTATSGRLPVVSSSAKLSNPPPKNYVVPMKSKSHLYE